MLIVPSMANPSNESGRGEKVSSTLTLVAAPITVTPEPAQTAQPEINSSSFLRILDLKTIQDNSNTAGLQYNTVIDKKNFTASQKKLSAALLMRTTASDGSQASSTTMSSGKPVYVYVYMKPGYSTHNIDSFVSEVPNRDEDNHIAVAWVDAQNLETVASLEGVRLIREVIPPVVNIGSVTTEGDTIHKTTNVRSTYGYTGAGMKIGIISDGVDNLAAAQATGDLPADVTVLSNTQGGDEGTAMLEIVHDMVPDAKLYFHDHGSNRVAFNAAIDALVADGCTVICDDIGWFDEPYFEDGIIASHVKNVLSGNNIIYVSSAGNMANGHYQGDFYSYQGSTENDFSRGTNASFHSLYIAIPPYSYAKIFLEWNDQFGYSGNDYDLYLTEMKVPLTFGDLGVGEDYQSGSGNPYENITCINLGSSTKNARIDVEKFSGVSKTLKLYIWGNPIKPVGTLSPYISPINLVASNSIFGHPAVPDVISVAAAPASSPSTIEPFSSRGPVIITYPSPEIRQKPDISGVDGVNVTGVGDFGSPFWGTSASAPHIAAIVAQYWGAHPAKTPAQVRSALYSSAINLGAPEWDPIFGYGRADAFALNGGKTSTLMSGVYRPGAGFYLKMDSSSTWNPSTDTYLAWDNAANDLPVAGDWNNDGRTETGVYRPGAGFYLKMDSTSTWNPSTDTYLAWDNAVNDRPIAGDWNNDGITETGVYRPGAGFYLKMDSTSTWNPSTDTYLAWDNAVNDRPIAGDWNNDGITETGVYRPGAGFYLKMDGSGTWNPSTDTYLAWDNAANDRPIAGDWNDDGITGTGVYRPGAGFYLKMDGNGTWNPSTDVFLDWDNANGDVPIAGIFG
jgi:hypothetical protein